MRSGHTGSTLRYDDKRCMQVRLFVTVVYPPTFTRRVAYTLSKQFTSVSKIEQKLDKQIVRSIFLF